MPNKTLLARLNSLINWSFIILIQPYFFSKYIGNNREKKDASVDGAYKCIFETLKNSLHVYAKNSTRHKEAKF